MTVAYGIVSSRTWSRARWLRRIAHLSRSRWGGMGPVLEHDLPRIPFRRATAGAREDRVESAPRHSCAISRTAVRGRQLPLDVRATAFQGARWEALHAYSPARRTTYGELARALGGSERDRRGRPPRAWRTNPVALLIPCHRVIAKNGTCAAYRWAVTVRAGSSISEPQRLVIDSAETSLPAARRSAGYAGLPRTARCRRAAPS